MVWNTFLSYDLFPQKNDWRDDISLSQLTSGLPDFSSYNIPKLGKICIPKWPQNTYTKWPQKYTKITINIPNGPKLYQIFPFQVLTKIGSFGMKIFYLATLHSWHKRTKVFWLKPTCVQSWRKSGQRFRLKSLLRKSCTAWFRRPKARRPKVRRPVNSLTRKLFDP
jgi:hypothetical protein